MSGPACPACGGPLAVWIEVPAGEPADPAPYPLLRCGACGSAVTGGVAPVADSYVTGDYAPAPPRLAGLLGAVQHLTTRQPVRMLRSVGVRTGAHVLDAGAGRGKLVRALGEAGFDARGIEPAARAGAGLPIAASSIAEHDDSNLDAVVLWHVLEHLDDPCGSLELVRSWMRPGGVLLVGVPNLDSWQARVAGHGWLHYDAPRHRTHFTLAGLRALLERTGYEVVKVEQLVWEFNPASMWMALLTRLGMSPGFPFHLLKRNAPLRARDLALLAIAGPLLALPALLLELAAAAGDRGGTIAVVASATPGGQAA